MSKIKWYVASAIVLFQYKDGVQDDYEIWENFYLIEADSSEEARKKAVKRVRRSTDVSFDHFFTKGRPSRMVLAGIRKVSTCLNPDERPTDGTELVTIKMRVDSKEELEKLASGKAVKVLYEE